MWYHGRAYVYIISTGSHPICTNCQKSELQGLWIPLIKEVPRPNKRLRKQATYITKYNTPAPAWRKLDNGYSLLRLTTNHHTQRNFRTEESHIGLQSLSLSFSPSTWLVYWCLRCGNYGWHQTTGLAVICTYMGKDWKDFPNSGWWVRHQIPTGLAAYRSGGFERRNKVLRTVGKYRDV